MIGKYRRGPKSVNELCSFCEKPKCSVERLIAGPGVYICNECVDLCNEIIEEERTPTR